MKKLILSVVLLSSQIITPQLSAQDRTDTIDKNITEPCEPVKSDCDDAHASELFLMSQAGVYLIALGVTIFWKIKNKAKE